VVKAFNLKGALGMLDGIASVSIKVEPSEVKVITGEKESKKRQQRQTFLEE